MISNQNCIAQTLVISGACFDLQVQAEILTGDEAGVDPNFKIYQ